MKPQEFLDQVVLLTGTELKGEQEIDLDSLSKILSDDRTPIDCSQFNELLLLVHKDRVEGPFFRYFFGPDCTIGAIRDGVSRYQKIAMLRYGNFVFAFRTLSRIKEDMAFQNELAEVVRNPENERKRFTSRRKKLLEIDKVERDLTPFVGYLSAGQVDAERERCELLCKTANQPNLIDWPDFELRVKKFARSEEHAVLFEIINNYRRRNPQTTLEEFAGFLSDSLHALNALDKQVQDVKKRAARNQSTYLTWDHMDVYFATSMRKPWEYKDLYDFIDNLMQSPELQDLGVRYFDPTQAYTIDRINKGLIEALMLKRARCTVYSVQDTDTLGKDSELASTLAQGKPVIAYVPQIDTGRRTKELQAEDPATILDRLRFVLYADEHLAKRLGQSEYDLLDEVQDKLEGFVGERIWRSLPDEQANDRLKNELGTTLGQFCEIIASSEKELYDSRAKTLTEYHPLAVQVNLATGVANGVLVVRSISDCAKLLYRILLFDMEFTLGNSHLRMDSTCGTFVKGLAIASTVWLHMIGS
jgi:hypothetical protein